MSPIKPAVRSPLQPVDDVVTHPVVVETVEHHLRLGVRYVVAVAVWNKQDIGRAGCPDAAKPKHD